LFVGIIYESQAFAFSPSFVNAWELPNHFIQLFIAAFTEVESLSPSKGVALSKEELIHFSQLSGKHVALPTEYWKDSVNYLMVKNGEFSSETL